MSNERWENDSYYSDEESDDDYAPLQMSSWGATATENRDGTTTVDVSVEGWATLIDPSVKIKSNGIGSGQLHRKGNNFKPVDESFIINRRLNLPVKGSGKKNRSGSNTPKSAPKKKNVKKSFPPPPPPPQRQERMVPPSSSATRGRPLINPNASAWGSANLASTPFWEQQQQSSTGSAASKYATHSAPPPQTRPPVQQQQSQWGHQAPPQQPPQQAPKVEQPFSNQRGQQNPQQAQQSAQQWGQQQPQQSQWNQPHHQPPPPQQSQWSQPQAPPQQPAQPQWTQPPQQQQPPPQQQQPQWAQQQQQQQQQPQSQAYLSKYAHGSDASIYAPQSAPPPAPTAQAKTGAPCIKFNIQLGVGITAELSVYENDSPEEVVDAFEKRHHLSMSEVAKANFAIKIRELLKQYTGQ